MIVAFENLFGGAYEGGANWLEASLLSLAVLPQPPTCLVIGATHDLLPETLREARHVIPVPAVRKRDSKAARLVKGVSRRMLGQPWEDPAIADIAKRYKVDLWVGFCGFEGLGPHRKLLVWYPDFQHRYFPEFFDRQELQDRERQWDYVAVRANGILVISESVAADALKTHPEARTKLFVCAFPPVFSESQLGLAPIAVCREYHLPERFLLVCNQFWTHKNHLLVLRALSWLREQGQTPPVVVFTGRPHDYRNPDAFSDLLRYVHSHGLHQYCRFLGVLPRAEQLAMIRAAEAVIQPSRFEGRGAIVEESHLLGTQVLCSDLPVHRELNAPGTLFFPVDGLAELAELMQRRFLHSNRSAADIARDSERLALDYGNHFEYVCSLVSGSAEIRPVDQNALALVAESE
jgi:glycosyltransferase involved in cell wall biosynthesis